MSESSPEQYDGFDPRTLAQYMEIDAIRGNQVLGRVREPVSENFKAIQAVLARMNLVAHLSRTETGHLLSCVPFPPHKPARIWPHVLLLLATLLTTLFVGAIHAGANPLKSASAIIQGWPFALSLLAVLGSHELAHYLAARRLGVDATLPYFLPVPHPLTGTMGAFIKIRSPIPSRGALVRVGVAGPLAGFLVCVPVTVIGLMLSKVEVVAGRDVLPLGTPLFFGFISRLVHGTVGAGCDVMLHPVAFAGWLGMLITGLNLLPAGQLDGGHVMYAILGRRFRPFAVLVLGVLLVGGLLWPGWIFWAVMIAVFGLRHPPPLDEVSPLGRTEVVLALVALLVFVLSFVPVPFPARVP